MNMIVFFFVQTVERVDWLYFVIYGPYCIEVSCVLVLDIDVFSYRTIMMNAFSQK